MKGSIEKPHKGQGRAGLKRKRPYPINQTINPPSELSQKMPGETKTETGKTSEIHSKDPTHSVNNVDEGMTHTRPLTPDVPSIQVQLRDHPPNLIDQTCQEVRKVHKVYLVQIILIKILI